MLTTAFSSLAAAPQQGAQRLRDLTVFPTLDLGFKFTFNIKGKLSRISGGSILPDEIAALQSGGIL